MGLIEAQVTLTVVFSSSLFLDWVFLIIFLTIPYRFSVRFRSCQHKSEPFLAVTSCGLISLCSMSVTSVRSAVFPMIAVACTLLDQDIHGIYTVWILSGLKVWTLVKYPRVKMMSRSGDLSFQAHNVAEFVSYQLKQHQVTMLFSRGCMVGFSHNNSNILDSYNTCSRDSRWLYPKKNQSPKASVNGSDGITSSIALLTLMGLSLWAG